MTDDTELQSPHERQPVQLKLAVEGRREKLGR
jgi:hypothetical protein